MNRNFLKTLIIPVMLIGATASGVSPAMAQDATLRPGIVLNPKVPEKMEFAGQTVSFDREDMYERMDRELSAIAYTHGNTLLTLKRANRYFPQLAAILKQQGVPADMIYLACVESWLNQRALSGAKAAGMWQLMPATAKELGLEVNNDVDERYDIEKSTAAACRLLKQFYRRFGRWESAAAAYNGGPARIGRELEAQNVDTAYDLYLTDETSRYMFRLLAMKLVMEHPEKYGFTVVPEQLYHAPEFETVEVDTPVEDWPAWAAEHGTNYMQLREANPWIRSKSLPNKSGKTYKVLVPVKESLYRSTQSKNKVQE